MQPWSSCQFYVQVAINMETVRWSEMLVHIHQTTRYRTHKNTVILLCTVATSFNFHSKVHRNKLGTVSAVVCAKGQSFCTHGDSPISRLLHNYLQFAAVISPTDTVVYISLPHFPFHGGIHTTPQWQSLQRNWTSLSCILHAAAYKYRVIHKSLRDFRTRLRNNQDRHGRNEHINR